MVEAAGVEPASAKSVECFNDYGSKYNTLRRE
jgi:hypothetical protein